MITRSPSAISRDVDHMFFGGGQYVFFLTWKLLNDQTRKSEVVVVEERRALVQKY